MEKQIKFCGIKIHKGDREAIYELFKSVGRTPEDFYKPDNQGRIRIENNRVHYIDANSLGLPSLPETIGNLGSLQRLDVRGNRLNKGSINLIKRIKARGVLVIS